MSELSTFEKGILENVERHGCQVNHVFDPDGEGPSFSYSIGFPTSVGQPEVICFGLASELMHSMINSLNTECRDGLVMLDGCRVSGLLDGFDCVLRKVLPNNIANDNFASALWYSKHMGRGVMKDAFQIVWPGSRSGLYPWDRDVSQDLIDAQPALYGVSA